MKYQSEIKSIGSLALSFREENMLILFGEKANSGIEDYSMIIQTPSAPVSIFPGDVFQIGQASYTVTAVGERVGELFSTLGHCTLCFDAQSQARLPGTIHLKGKYPDCRAGDIVSINGKEKETE